MTERTKFVCGTCSFKFARDKASKLSKTCPNCGTQSVYEYKPLNADYFLKSVN